MYFNMVSTQLLCYWMAIFNICFYNGNAIQTLSCFSLLKKNIGKFHDIKLVFMFSTFKDLHIVDPVAS